MKTVVALLSALAIGAEDCLPNADYKVMREMAVTFNMPLIVGVGCNPPKGEWITTRVETWPDIQSGIIVSYCKDGELYWLTNLPVLDPKTSPTMAQDVRNVLNPPRSPQRWNPYQPPRVDPMGRRTTTSGIWMNTGTQSSPIRMRRSTSSC